MMIIHELKLSSAAKADSFEEFARDRYLPSLRIGPTRAGEWSSVSVLRRRREHESDAADLDRQFLLIVDWSGVPIGLPRCDDDEVQAQFDSFAIEVSRLGSFDPTAARVNEGLIPSEP